jgi:hypothetical protein
VAFAPTLCQKGTGRVGPRSREYAGISPGLWLGRDESLTRVPMDQGVRFATIVSVQASFINGRSTAPD